MSKSWKSFVPFAIAAVSLAALGACSWLPFRVEGERPFLSEHGPQRKTVVSKEPPSRLVAVDGTVCLVPAPKYESVEVDDKVWCDWRPRG